jgi:RHS repeat-associated protein
MDEGACWSSVSPHLVGDPIDTLTGAAVDRSLDFRLTGPIELRWTRYYDSSERHRTSRIGNGWAHEFDRFLTLRPDGVMYSEPIRAQVLFPAIGSDGADCARDGLRLHRVSANRYMVSSSAWPTMEFVFPAGASRARLSRLLEGGFEVRFRYDLDGKLTTIYDSAGRCLMATEAAEGRLLRLAVGTPEGREGELLIAYGYDDRGNLVRTANGQGHGYAYEYDHDDRLVLRRGRKGFRFYFTYDAHGRCTRSMGDGRLYGVALDYRVPGRLTKVTRPDGGVWTYHFTPRGQLHAVHDPLGGVQTFVRDATGRLALEVDPNGSVSRVVYDSAGAPVAKVNGLGHRTRLPEDPNAPDPLAHQIAANPAEYEYGRLLNVERIVLPDRSRLHDLALSDGARALVIAGTPESEPIRQRFEVPPLRVLWWPPPKSGRIFNDLGKLLAQRDLFGRVRRWSYDESGNVADHVDFDGRRWIHDYGAWHFRRGLTDPLGREIRYTHTPYGAVESFTDAGGTVSEYRYDRKDGLVEVRRHGQVRETYTRDAAGHLIAKHGADGSELLRIEVGQNGHLPVRRVLASGDEHRFQHDKSGRPLVAETNRDRVEFAYDILGNAVRETRNGRGVECRFQGWRRPAEMMLFERFAVRYERRTGALFITDPGGKSHAIRLAGNGVIERRFSSGSTETSQYDNLGRCLFKYAERKRSGLWSRRYEWSGEGELTRIEDNRRGETRHEYDAAHRLRSRTGRRGVERFEMDDADNLVEQPGLAGVSLCEGNRLRTANGFRFTYNDRNHIDVREHGRDATRYHYDSRDQLVLVDLPTGPWRAEYDALGRRTRKAFEQQTTEYYWYGDQLMAEVRGKRLRIYVYADPLALVPLLFIDYESDQAPLDSGRRYFVFTDQIGTPLLVEDEEGSDIWSAEISPFGSANVAPGSNTEVALRFPGHYFDPELGLHYNRSRYYDCVLGRYLQSDPAGISGGHNLYAYAVNPLLSVDAIGLGEDGTDCKNREDGAEGTDDPTAPPQRRMTDEELQAAADFIRHGGKPDPKDWSTLTVTEGLDANGQPVYTVTSSRGPKDFNDGHNLTPGELGRAQQVFGPDVNTPVEARAPAGEGSHHGEQRGMRATEDQTERRQASSNQTGTTRSDPDVGHMGAACSHCAAAQRNAVDAGGNPNPVQNTTGTIEDGGRTNNPKNPGAWKGWTNE